MEELKSTIQSLIDLKKEGGFWDYKEAYTTNKADFLHDIICMTNNLEDRDAYLIYGVRDNGEIVGFSENSLRKNQNEIINLLKDKSFNGGIRPDILLNSITLDCCIEIDVLTIKNTNKTPYFLTKDFSEQGRIVKASYIYTRIGDKNTDIDKIADPDKIEYLWKKNLELKKTAMERLQILLDDWENWGVYGGEYYDNAFIQGGDFGNKNYIFHKYFPEYKIEIFPDSKQSWEMETMKCFYANQTAGHYDAKIYYNSTELCSFYIAHVDEYRKFLAVPRVSGFENELRKKETGPRCFGENRVNFYYITENSIIGKVEKIITNGNYNTISRDIAAEEYWLLIFKDEDDVKSYINFAQENPDLYKVGLKNGEYTIGTEKEGAHIPMTDIHNAYRFYVEYLISIKRREPSQFEDYFRWYNNYLSIK